MFQGILTAFGTLIVVIVILYLTYICTKYMGKSMRFKGNARSSRYIKMIDQLPLGQDSSIALVKMDERLLLLGITSSQINFLTELTGEGLTEIPEAVRPEAQTMDFGQLMSRLKDRKK